MAFTNAATWSTPTEPQKAADPAPATAPTTPPATDPASNPWAAYDPRFQQLYAQYGVTTPGARGSGFTDVGYWNDVLNGAAGGDWGYISGRLGADLAGTGTDARGGDSGGGGGGYNYGAFNYTPWQPSQQANDLYSTLMGRAQQSLEPSAKDPIIANQVNAYGAQQQRGERDYLSSLAEKEGPQANLGMEKRMASEQASQATGQLQASLMQNEVNARRQEIQNALSQMGGMLSQQQQLALQKELAYLSNDQFLRQLGLQAENQASQWDWLRSTGGGA